MTGCARSGPTEARYPNLGHNKKQSQVVICVYPITDCAGDLWAQFKDTSEQLWQIQVDHDARPSISVNIRRSFEEYLKEASQSGGGSFPDTIPKLQSEAGIKLTMTGKDDTDSLGCFVQYRIAWYVAGGMGALENFFLLFDGYMQYKQKQFARRPCFILPSDFFLGWGRGSRPHERSQSFLMFNKRFQGLRHSK